MLIRFGLAFRQQSLKFDEVKIYDHFVFNLLAQDFARAHAQHARLSYVTRAPVTKRTCLM